VKRFLGLKRRYISSLEKMEAYFSETCSSGFDCYWKKWSSFIVRSESFCLVVRAWHVDWFCVCFRGYVRSKSVYVRRVVFSGRRFLQM